VAIDRWGRSSCGSGKRTTPDDPGFIPGGTPAQQTVFIDYTTPELYLRSLQTNSQNNQVEISWMGFDPYLGDHPVKLFWQMNGGNNRDLSSQQWNPIGTDHLATGQFSWQVPADVTGQVIVKAVLTDQAGNQDIKYSSPVLVKAVVQELPQPQVKELPQPEPVAAAPVVVAPVVADAPVAGEPESPKIAALPLPCRTYAEPLAKTSDEPKFIPSEEAAPTSDDMEKDQAVERYYRSGSLHSRRGELARAKQAYMQVLELEPHYISARVNLADVLCRLGEFSQAKQQYERCLQIKPNHKQALFGLAQVQIALTQFGQARQTRDKLLSLEDRGWQTMLDQPEKPIQPGGTGLTSTGGTKQF
jgi:tetratricopeptide (TPR) repeat protein